MHHTGPAGMSASSAAAAMRSRGLFPSRRPQLLGGFMRVPFAHAAAAAARPAAAAPSRGGDGAVAAAAAAAREPAPLLLAARPQGCWASATPGGSAWAAQRPAAPLAAAPARAFGTKKRGKKKLTFKLAKKLLRVRNDAVPYKHRQKRAILMNYAQYTINYPFESHWNKFVPHRLSAASNALESVFSERYGVEVGAAAPEEEGEDEDTSPLELPELGVAELADAYHSAAGDPDALLKLMQAGHAQITEKQ